jgi:hypothetical protein
LAVHFYGVFPPLHGLLRRSNIKSSHVGLVKYDFSDFSRMTLNEQKLDNERIIMIRKSAGALPVPCLVWATIAAALNFTMQGINS